MARPTNPLVEYRFLLGQYFRLRAEDRDAQDLIKVLARLDEIWESMTETQHRSIWK